MTFIERIEAEKQKLEELKNASKPGDTKDA